MTARLRRIPILCPNKLAAGGATPEFHGESLRGAFAIARAHGIQIETSGEGYVVGQNPSAGTPAGGGANQLTLAEKMARWRRRRGRANPNGRCGRHRRRARRIPAHTRGARDEASRERRCCCRIYWLHYVLLSGFFLLRDEDERKMDLPSGDFEIPLLLQDRNLDDNGQLVYSPTHEDGVKLAPGVWGPEFFGNLPVVNGAIYPYFRRSHRARFVFACLTARTPRFFNLI